MIFCLVSIPELGGQSLVSFWFYVGILSGLGFLQVFIFNDVSSTNPLTFESNVANIHGSHSQESMFGQNACDVF